MHSFGRRQKSAQKLYIKAGSRGKFLYCNSTLFGNRIGVEGETVAKGEQVLRNSCSTARPWKGPRGLCSLPAEVLRPVPVLGRCLLPRELTDHSTRTQQQGFSLWLPLAAPWGLQDLGIRAGTSVKAPSPNRWTTREFPSIVFGRCPCVL